MDESEIASKLAGFAFAGVSTGMDGSLRLRFVQLPAPDQGTVDRVLVIPALCEIAIVDE